MVQHKERELIERLVAGLRETEIGYTPNSGYEMCNSCREVIREDLGRKFQHRDDCRWKAAVAAAETYLTN